MPRHQVSRIRVYELFFCRVSCIFATNLCIMCVGGTSARGSTNRTFAFSDMSCSSTCRITVFELFLCVACVCGPFFCNVCVVCISELSFTNRIFALNYIKCSCSHVHNCTFRRTWRQGIVLHSAGSELSLPFVARFQVTWHTYVVRRSAHVNRVAETRSGACVMLSPASLTMRHRRRNMENIAAIGTAGTAAIDKPASQFCIILIGYSEARYISFEIES